MNINAISTTPAAIEAALQSAEVRQISSLLASIGIEKPKSKIKLADLNAKFAAAGTPTQKRLEAKIILGRANLLADD
jgi:hypothetical protein